MINVGVIGLDSSHPEAFAEILENRTESAVSAVWDGRDVRTPEYATEFCDRFDAVLYDEPTAMLADIDTVMILTVNWNTHRRLAVPFLEADLPTFVDKPLAGCLSDIEAIYNAASDGSLFGGSAVPFHPSLADLPVGQQERTLYCVGYDDPFYYGVHLADTARLLAGCDWRAVEPANGSGAAVDVLFRNGTWATLRFDGTTEGSTFGVLDVGDRTRVREAGSNETVFSAMYERFIDAFLAGVRGERDDTRRLVDGARLLLAIRAVLETGNRVTPDDDALGQARADGEAFLAEYAPYY